MVFSDAALQAYNQLRSLDNFQWYVVPLLVFVIYVYSIEIRKRNWNRVYCGIGLFAGELIWEMTNALICYFSGYSGLWVTPGESAFIIFVGLNIEIAFFFALLPIVVFNCLDAFKRDEKITIFGKGIPNRLLIPLILGLACVFVEVLLNQWGALVWDWPFWNWPVIPLIIVAYTLPIYFITWVYDHENLRAKKRAVALVVLLSILLFVTFTNLGWV